MKKSLKLLAFILLISEQTQAQNLSPNLTLPIYNRAILWRGFDHTWSYNHRINRLGSYVFLDKNGTPKGTHYSASGLGPDSTEFQIFYTYLENPKLYFYQGKVSITLTGKETQLLTESKEFSVNVPEWFRNKGKYKSLINGFEIKSVEKADLPIHFMANIDDPIYSEPSKEMKFRVHFNWVGNCRSAECSVFKNTTTYELTVHYLLIGYEKEDAIAFQFLNTNSYSWGTDIEYSNDVIKKNYQIFPSKFNSANIGIKSFGFTFNEEQWIQQVNYKVAIDNYDAAKGEVNASLNMLLLDWKEGMKTRSKMKGKAMFAHKKGGWVTMDLTTLILQSNDTKSIDGSTDGTMFWQGWNANPLDKSAEKEQFLKFNF